MHGLPKRLDDLIMVENISIDAEESRKLATKHRGPISAVLNKDRYFFSDFKDSQTKLKPLQYIWGMRTGSAVVKP